MGQRVLAADAGLGTWNFGGGGAKGTPAIAVSGGTACITARDYWDAWNSLWMARVQYNAWLGWSYGGGIMNGDPQVMAARGRRTRRGISGGPLAAAPA